MEFLSIPLFDDDFYKMMFRLLVNVFFLTIIIRGLYNKKTKDTSFTFTYYMIGIIVFFLCFTLKKYELDIGMALGLFAIFGIIRYRTESIDIKEMTYLFIVIGVSVINALANKKMSYSEILGANMVVVVAIYIVESTVLKQKELKMLIKYEKVDNIHFTDDEAFLADLKERLGINVTRYEISKVNYLRNTADIEVYYTIDKPSENSVNDDA
ncbi:MAG: DUF4956 domain-containing protein [Saprospiraceae bacterium]